MGRGIIMGISPPAMFSLYNKRVAKCMVGILFSVYMCTEIYKPTTRKATLSTLSTLPIISVQTSTPVDVWARIEHVIYINLDKRTDRNAQMKQELAYVFPLSKITQFTAALADTNRNECTKSHIGALKLAIARNYSNVLIVEDDLEWVKAALDQGKRVLTELLDIDSDVIMFGGSSLHLKFSTKNGVGVDAFRIETAVVATAYIVPRAYYATLIANLEHTLVMNSFNDVQWQILQKKYRWYFINPMMITQRPSYSDIQHDNYKQFIAFAN